MVFAPIPGYVKFNEAFCLKANVNSELQNNSSKATTFHLKNADTEAILSSFKFYLGDCIKEIQKGQKGPKYVFLSA